MSQLSPHKVWLGIFSIWGVILTGVFHYWVGSPGALQSLRLNHLLESKQEHLSKIQDEIKALQAEAHQLDRSKVVQQREIRRVLGYTAHDEIIFDFNTTGVL